MRSACVRCRRCTAASRDQFAHAARQVEIELNACTDNPLVLGSPDNWRVVSQANPQGESVAMAADLLAIAKETIGREIALAAGALRANPVNRARADDGVERIVRQTVSTAWLISVTLSHLRS
ncbi:hypothetical protein E05_09530 [Plautia stali symbiont]|nr:hypothetical protein E05_09530 [Plautia stali symbiont]